MSDVILALDFGGTKATAGVVVDGERSWLALQRSPLPPGLTAAEDLAHMIGLARLALAGRRPGAVGVSFGGPVDASAGVVRRSYHVPGWEAVPLANMIATEFGAPTKIDNDGNVAALGEAVFGAGQGCRSLLYLTVSTGVGGGWVIDGEIWRGAHNLAGEFGHMTLDPDGPVCPCGRRGCVERLAAGPWIAERARALLADGPGDGALLRRLVGDDLTAIDARRVAEAAEQGDVLAWQALSSGARALGIGIGNAVNLIDPELVVLGGGVSKSGPRYWAAVRAAALATALTETRLRLVPAALGDESPLWGAVALARC